MSDEVQLRAVPNLKEADHSAQRVHLPYQLHLMKMVQPELLLVEKSIGASY